MPRRGTLATILTGLFVTVLDFFIVNVALPDIAAELHAGPAALQWVVAGYGLAYGSGLVLGGRLGDLYGRRRVFAVGLALFALTSAACGLAPSAGTLVAARVAQGAAAAVLTPQVIAVIRAGYHGPAQARAIGRYALVAGLAAVFGQLAGGILIRADLFGLGWRACFLINVPVAAAALAALRRTVPESRAEHAARLDPLGALLITLGLTAILLPLIEGRAQGWPLWTWLSFAAAVLLLGGNARRRHPSPVIDPALFRERPFTVGLLAQLAFSLAMAAYFLVFALWAQDGRGLDALGSGLLFAPIGAGYLAASLGAGRLTRRLGRQVVALGGAVRATALTVLLVLVASGAPLAAVVPVLALDGIGMGLAFGPIMGMVLARVTPRHAGAAAGALTTVQQVGGAIGVGVIGVVYYAAASGGGGAAAGFRHGLVLLIGLTLALAVLAQLLDRAGRAEPAAERPVDADAAADAGVDGGREPAAVADR